MKKNRLLQTLLCVTLWLFGLAQASAALPPIKIVICGDSTVANYDTNKTARRGWGQMIGEGFNSNVTVVNLAKNGRSTKTFIAQGLLQKAVADKADYALIQFGHNDSHAKGRPESTDAATDFKEYLRQFVDDFRAAGTKPILVTPMHRRHFEAVGKPTSELQPYAQAMKEVAEEKHVPVVDLQASSGELLARLGEAGSEDLFYPGDRTHFGVKGARTMANLALAGLAREVPELKPYIVASASDTSTSTEAGGIAAPSAGAQDRAYSVQVLTRIAEPVLTALAEGRLKQEMPVHDWEKNRVRYAPLEALGRMMAGIAPWLELGPDHTEEGQLRAKFIDLSVKAIANATDPRSPDFMNFNRGAQPLVDAAFLAHGLLRAPKQLWGRFNEAQRSNIVAALKSTRIIKPGENNWLLFSAMVEAALWHFTGECQMKPIEYAVHRHDQWYLGDGTYGDGREFHWDYYNSYVIQPMLIEVLRVCAEKKNPLGDLLPKVTARAKRYAEVQERLISPEGTFPVIGRSSAYRFGAMQELSNMALLHELPPELKPGAVRSALTAVIRRMIEAPGTFDDRGWLQVGAVGHQPSIREGYISTGSLYLCLTGMLHLGLPPDDPFWTAPAAPWTQKRIWAGEDIKPDHAYHDRR